MSERAHLVREAEKERGKKRKLALEPLFPKLALSEAKLTSFIGRCHSPPVLAAPSNGNYMTFHKRKTFLASKVPL